LGHESSVYIRCVEKRAAKGANEKKGGGGKEEEEKEEEKVEEKSKKIKDEARGKGNEVFAC
jgi:hypothetical protein